MSSPSIRSGEDLIQAILSGRVPRQVRLFAAQGLLPISRDDLLRLQVILATDPDPELAEIASASVKEHPARVIVDWLSSADIKPLELDLIVRVRDEEEIWAGATKHPGVSDETLRVLALHGPPLIQDIIITNQSRVMGCLELLDDLRANAAVTQVVLRRVREFEEEFIEKAIAAAARDEEETSRGPTLEEALVALKAIGAHLPREKDLPLPKMGADDPALAEAIEREGGSAFARLLTMSVKDKIMAALKGGREERAILVNSRNRLVARAVLASPKLNESEVEKYASSRSVSSEVIRTIAGHNRWMQKYPLVLAIVQNPKTPATMTLRLIQKLNARDLARVMRDRSLDGAVRNRARFLFGQRK